MTGSGRESPAPADKSLFHYGSLYHKLLDPLIKPARQAIVELVPAGSKVLDIGCGTGMLCLDLRRQKNCRVVGVDLSRRMLDFARSHSTYQDVEFLWQDATDLKDLPDKGFDYVVMLNLIHELPAEARPVALKEAFGKGGRVILLDGTAPLPWNLAGMVKRLIEITLGSDHYPQFRSYLAAGGVMGILAQAGYAEQIVHRAVLTQGVNQLVMVAQ